MSRLFRDRNFIFILAVALALTTGQLAIYTEQLMLPALAVAMTLSTINITNHDIISMRRTPRLILTSFIVSYVVMGGVMLLMARWLIKDSELWAGFVTLAAVPPATSVIPFSYVFGGNMVLALLGTTGLYLAALGLTPGIMTLFLGTTLLDPKRLLTTLIELIIIPLGISRLLLARGLAQNIAKWQDTAINWCFFITIFTIIGLNRQFLFAHPDIFMRVALIAVITTFGLGYTINLLARRLNKERSIFITLMIMATRKNTALASVIGLNFFGEKGAFPAAILAMFSILFIVSLGFYLRKRVRAE